MEHSLPFIDQLVSLFEFLVNDIMALLFLRFIVSSLLLFFVFQEMVDILLSSFILVTEIIGMFILLLHFALQLNNLQFGVFHSVRDIFTGFSSSIIEVINIGF